MDKSNNPPMLPFLKCPLPSYEIFRRDMTGQVIPGASSADLLAHHGFTNAKTVLIAKRNNERLARKMDAAKFLDEAKRGLWNDPKEPSFQILKRVYDNQAFHFRDEKN